MSKKSLVSVIIIFLNAEKFIEEAIESVLAQTYEDWELLLVDDGSTDASTSIAQRYAAENPQQVHYLEHPNHQNQGMSASRNLGIRHAKGEYVAFLDADDVWLPRKLEQQVTILDSKPEAVMVYGKTEYWYSWTGHSEDSPRDYVQSHGIEANTLYKPPVLLILFLTGKAAIPPPCSVLVRRGLIAAIGGFEESFRGLYEDQVLYAKVCLEAPVFISTECWDRYRQHPQSSCSVAERTGQIHCARMTYLNWLTAYLSQRGFRGTEVWQALRRAVWLHRYSTWLPFPSYNQHLVRWMKKWLLRLEEWVVPAPIRRRLWS